MRVTHQQKEVLQQAARVRGTTITHFLLEESCRAAEEILADQREFRLGDAEWERFCAAIDAPAKEIPALRKLLTEPSILDA